MNMMKFTTKQQLTAVLLLCLLLLVDLSEAARNRDRPRKNKQSKRQQKSEVIGGDEVILPGACADLNKKILRLKYEAGINGTNLSGVAMLPTPAQPTPRGVTFATAVGAPRVSTCPSDLVENYDSQRWPRVIMEARCSCQQCNLNRQPRGFRSPCPAEERPAGSCRSIMREIAVLRRAGCVGDFARYEWDVVNVSVGCECVIGS